MRDVTPPTLTFIGGRLRPLQTDDAPALYAYLSDPATTALTGYPEVTFSLAELIIARAQQRWAVGDVAKWGLTLPDDDRVIGTCGFNQWFFHGDAELAYDLAPAFWGQGLMRQAVAAVLTWAFNDGARRRVHAFVRHDNRRSACLLERSGFVREGCLRGYRLCRGVPYDFTIFGLLREEWPLLQGGSGRCDS